MGGIPMLTGYPGGPPTLTFQAISDPIGGMFGAAAVVTALHHQQRTGEGQFVDLSQQEALLSVNVEPLLDYSLNQRTRARAGNRHWAMAPHGVFACREPDTWVALAIPDDDAWARFRAMDGSPVRSVDDRLSFLPERLARREELESCIEAWTRTFSPKEVTARLQAAGIPSGPVMSVADIAVDAHAQARASFKYIDHDEVGPYLYYVSAPLRYGTSALDARKSAPKFGADNHDVLSRILGLSDEQIAQLEDDQVIASRPLEAVLIDHKS
jgi:crotonobetainyl-CoA:carnitine CoA-transferase CaiB-like acyl-CoA transferase